MGTMKPTPEMLTRAMQHITDSLPDPAAPPDPVLQQAIPLAIKLVNEAHQGSAQREQIAQRRHFGKQIREVRLRKNLSIQTVASQTGVEVPTWIFLETGLLPSQEIAKLLDRALIALGVSSLAEVVEVSLTNNDPEMRNTAFEND